MPQGTETITLGAEQVTVVIEFDLSSVWLISGDFSGTIPSGQTGFINGDVNQTGDVFVEGLLTGVDTFHWQGNGFSVFFQNGGQADLHGVVKGKWGEWGTGSPKSADTTNWLPGDLIGITPTKYKNFTPISGIWNGAFDTMVRPTNALDVALVNNGIGIPEVVNRSQSIVFEDLARGFHFHNSAGVQHLSDIKFLNCGTTGVVGNYPVHFHQLYDNSRGSTVTRVVVEGGKNHAFVPHGSHGITLLDCVAWNTTNDAFWWDPPPPVPTGQPASTVNDSNDILWQHCLAAGQVQQPGSTDSRLTAFYIAAGNGNRCIDSVAACVRGPGKEISGFHWSENFVWEFVNNIAHNIERNGIMTWTNSQNRHIIDGFDAYHCGQAPIEHGAYKTQFVYRNVTSTVTNPIVGGSTATRAILQHSNSIGAGLLFENIVTDDRLVVAHHGLLGTAWTVHRNCHYSGVVYSETGGSGPVHPSKIRYEGCGLLPANFTLGAGIVPTSEIEIVEGGVLAHRWVAGVWS